MLIVLSLLAFVALPALGAAQEPPSWRYLSPLSGFYVLSNPEEFGYLFMANQLSLKSGVLTWSEYAPNAEKGTLSLPFDMPGDLADGQTDDAVLVVGFDSQSSVGHICHVHFSRADPKGLVITSQAQFRARDPINVFWNATEERLYITDRRNRELLTAAWPEGAPMPSSFSVALAETQAPFLDGTDNWFMLEGASGETIVRKKLSATHYLVELTNGVWSAQVRSDMVGPGSMVTYVGSPMTVNSLWPIKLFGPSGTFDIVDTYTGEEISGAIATSNTWEDFSGPVPLVPGHVHHLVRPGAEAVAFAPLARHGEPTTQDGIRAGQGIISWGDHCVGSDEFSATVTLTAETPPSGFAHDANLYLWVAAALPSSPPPIVDVNGATVLVAADSVGPVTAHMSEGEPTALIGLPYPIRGDVGLAGVRLYMQFAADTPASNTIVSDVFAVDIMSQEDLQAATSGQRIKLRSYRTSEQRRAIRRWFDGSFSPGEQAAYRAMVQALR